MNKAKEILEEKEEAFSTEGSLRVIVSMAEYTSLKADQALLDLLFANGVDNWKGYSHTIKVFRKNHE